MITKKNYMFFFVFFFLYRFFLIYFDIVQLNFIDYSALQLKALSNHFIETLWFYGTLPIGNLIINKISIYFIEFIELNVFYYSLNSFYTFFSLILFSKILVQINYKKTVIFLFFILISLLMTSYERWSVYHHDHINLLIFTLISYYLFFLINKKEANILILSLIFSLLLLFNTLSIFLLFGLYFIKSFICRKNKKFLNLNLILIFFLILNISVHIKNRINFNLFSATTVSNLNLIQKTIHAIGIDNFQNLVKENDNINLSIKECYNDIYLKNRFNLDELVGLHIDALCFYDFKNNKYSFEKIIKIPNFEDNEELKGAIIDDELIFNNNNWITQFGYKENNLKTKIYFQSLGPTIFLEAFLEYPFEMIVGKIGAKGFLLTVAKSLSWGATFPLNYQADNYNWNILEKLISQFFRFFNIIGLFLCIYYVPIVFKKFYKEKVISNIDIYYLSLIFISSIVISLTSLITCCENDRLIVIIFFIVTIISVINYTKLMITFKNSKRI